MNANKVLIVSSFLLSGVAVCLSTISLTKPQPIQVYKTDQNGQISRFDSISPVISPDTIRKILVDHPDILLDAAKSLQATRDTKMQKDSAGLVAENARELFDVPADRFIGNPNGKHVVAVFFDYLCPHCREAEPGLREAVSKDPELKIAFHEFPVISQFSIVDTAAALGAAHQEKYMAFHDALMDTPAPYDMEKIYTAAKKADLDRDKLDEYMKSPALNGEIAAVLKLGNSIGVNATPAFAVKGGGVMLGWTDIQRFQAFVNRVK